MWYAGPHPSCSLRFSCTRCWLASSRCWLASSKSFTAASLQRFMLSAGCTWPGGLEPVIWHQAPGKHEQRHRALGDSAGCPCLPAASGRPGPNRLAFLAWIQLLSAPALPGYRALRALDTPALTASSVWSCMGLRRPDTGHEAVSSDCPSSPGHPTTNRTRARDPEHRSPLLDVTPCCACSDGTPTPHPWPCPGAGAHHAPMQLNNIMCIQPDCLCLLLY